MNEHPKYDTCFFERYARETLIDLVGTRYAGLVNLDRPDLQDHALSIGIEVTRAMREGKRPAENMINNVAGEQVVSPGLNQERTNKIMDEDKNAGYGFVLNGQAIGKAEKIYWQNALPLQNIIHNKVEKVIDGFYGHFKEFGLYIFSLEHLQQSDIVETVDWIVDLQKGKELHYDYLYISQCDELWECNLNLREATRHAISVEKRKFYYHKALVMEEDRLLKEKKESIRRLIRSRKHGYMESQLVHWSKDACHQIERTQKWKEAKSVLLYSNLPDEIQTKQLMEHAISSGKTVVLPAVVGDDLELRLYKGEESLQTGAFHILEPNGNAYFGGIDLAIVPGMAFDKKGHRLGRGKGFYDRLFCHLNCYKIGLCFHFQILESLPVEEHDICMDCVISNVLNTPQLP